MTTKLLISALVLALAACNGAPTAATGAGDDATGGADANRGAAAGSDAAIVAAACTGLAAQPVDSTWHQTVNNVARQYDVHVPASYDPTRATPIVINLHGLESSGSGQQSLTSMDAKADAEGFIAIHPNGTGSPLGWNGGACCNPASASGIDDVAFVSQLIDNVSTKLCVDPARVFVAGFSNGGFLAHSIACELADKVAAIGAVSGVLGIATCNPTRAVPVIDVHGTGDFIIPYGGGGVNNNISVADTITGWTTRNGCTAAPTTVYTHGDATCVNHGGCSDGADVELCTISGGGHQWPGGQDLGILNGAFSSDLDATDAIWAFFVAHPRS